MAMRLMSILLLFLAMHLTMVASRLNVGYTEPPVPAVYIFGDSTFDVGTNNFLNDTKSKADMRFYGIDYPYSKPTGRFSNGYNTADCIVQLLGYKESPPPFLCLVQNDTEHFNSQILKGVNFAGGGSGILDETGKFRFVIALSPSVTSNSSLTVRVISMEKQIKQFSTVCSNISQYLNGTGEARINKSLFLISVGSNDINEFLLFNVSNSSSVIQQVQAFIPFLMGNYQAHLKDLISLGARKFGILSLAPLGCVPDVRASYGGNCSNDINVVAQFFHTALHAMLLNLSSEFPDLKYSLGNTYTITLQMIDNPAPLHLSDVRRACCGNQTLTGGTPCSPEAAVCEDRDHFLFWDRHHPTTYGSKLAALSLFSGGSEYVAPTNFSILVQPS